MPIDIDDLRASDLDEVVNEKRRRFLDDENGTRARRKNLRDLVL
jgi:hypothetical protein